jgi:D-alanyl-lipoteichoic acid acyltransferase DltB (MBOAT superfamily)
MIVPSPQFLLFALVGAVLFNLNGRPAWHRAVLLAVNLLFIASFSSDPMAFVPFAGFLALGYGAYRATRNGARPHLFVALLILVLLVFFWLKRYTFIPSGSFLPFPYLLVGLSYVFFRVMHVIIDGHEESIDEPIGVLSYVNYTLNFTSLVSGPIQRYQDYRRMEVAPPPLTLVAAGQGFERIVLGYFKVAIVSMALSLLQHRAIDGLAAGDALMDRVWSGSLIMAVYPVYLYFNFSGYVDVVIGVARFFRIELPENFDRPFSSENFIAFWSRWHMTLSNWLKTYVYNPLMMAGMRRIPAPELAPYLGVFAFFVTFFLVGLWHGQTSEFLFFGVLQGGGVSANKLYQVLMAKRLGRAKYRALCAKPLYVMFSRGLTFTWFAFTLLWFWSSWTQIDTFVTELGGAGVVLVCLVTWLAATVILAAMEAARSALLRVTWSVDPGVREPVFWSRYLRTAYGTTMVLVTVTVTVLLAAPAPDIVYKAF